MGSLNVEDDQRSRELQQEYLDFLDDDQDTTVYSQKLKDMIGGGGIRLIVNVNDLRRKNSARAKNLLANGFEELIAFQRSLKEFVASADPVYAKQHEDFFIGLEGSFGGKHVTPRTLTSSFLGNMVCVEGIVTKSSLIRPKVVRSVHYCPATKKTIERKYTDMTSLEAFPSTGIYPTKDDDGNILETEYGLSIYKDHQTFSIQEMPEKAPAGQLPRSVDVICDDDLVDACKPGDRVQVVALYRCLPSKKNGFTNGTFRTVLVSNNIQLLSKEASPTFSAKDISMIKKFAKQKADVFEILSRSLAPTIWGFEYVKKAILCMLLGGVEKVLENGTRIRGDINLLLIGDPSVAKSQMLRYVLHTAPRAVTTTGRGSSGVGLTAAVTTDYETGERRLEAGAMVLADRGIVCIDEFDKMSDIDRTAIHEVMEQGRVTISKAGIHAKLNARCSVLAAANPVYGRYNQYKTPMENIGLQDSLLSRFDLLFIVLDMNDPENDRMIADHILKVQRFRNPGEQDGEALPLTTSLDLLSTHDVTDDVNEDEETPLYEKFDFLGSNKGKGKRERIISMKFMRKYIHVAREMKPTMTNDAASFIAEEYSKLRNQDVSSQGDNIARTQPLTARSLETMIRLSTAHAKCRLSKTVDAEDAQVAIELIHYAYFKKVLKKEKRRKRSSATSDEEDVEPDSEVEDTPAAEKEPKKKKRKAQPTKEGEEGFDPYDMGTISDEEEDLTSTLDDRKKSAASTDGGTKASAASFNQERLKQFKAVLFKMFKQANMQSLALDAVQQMLDEEFKSQPFAAAETLSVINKMQDDNQVMIADNIIFLI